MFYEDIRIGQSADLGQIEFSREAILAYGKLFDPRIVARAAEGRARLALRGCTSRQRGCADWWTAAAPCAPLWPSEARPFRSLASPRASKTCAGHIWSMRAISFLFGGDGVETRDLQAEMGPRRQYVSRDEPTRQEVLVFSSAVLIARGPKSCSVLPRRSADYP